jgi:hypothetical protein
MIECCRCRQKSPALQWIERPDDWEHYSFYTCPLCKDEYCSDPGALDDQKLVETILAALDPEKDKNAIDIITDKFLGK